MGSVQVLKFSAFTTGVDWSGNPAGVVLGAEALSDAEMLGIASDLGFSETAFLTNITGASARIRYFTPRAEIAFCGHATIASGVALARHGIGPVVTLTTNAGEVPVQVTPTEATLTAVETTVRPLPDALLNELLAGLRLTQDDLDPLLPSAFILGGNPHPLVPVKADVLPRLQHDPEAILALQDREGWDGTIPVVHRLGDARFASRNPFPRGGISEDPATGSAAAGLGAYLRAHALVNPPVEVVVEQGTEIGRPSLIRVKIPVTGRISVTGTAAEI